MFICSRSLEDLDRSDFDIKFFLIWEGHLMSNTVFINSKVQVIVLGSTAVIGLVLTIKSASIEVYDRNEKLRHLDEFFQNCSLKKLLIQIT
jgi:hypothetical protein